MSIRTGAILVLTAFAVTFAYYVGNKLTAEAVNVAIGVLCGIGASIPVSLGLVIALTRERERDNDETEPDSHPAPPYGSPRPQMPQIIVVAPPQAQYGQGQPTPGYPFGAPGAAYPGYMPPQNEEIVDGRDWRIIGDDA